jgi:hypothetical protein
VRTTLNQPNALCGVHANLLLSSPFGIGATAYVLINRTAGTSESIGNSYMTDHLSTWLRSIRETLVSTTTNSIISITSLTADLTNARQFITLDSVIFKGTYSLRCSRFLVTRTDPVRSVA